MTKASINLRIFGISIVVVRKRTVTRTALDARFAALTSGGSRAVATSALRAAITASARSKKCPTPPRV